MKVTQTWKRNPPSSAAGESITLTTVYSSLDKREIDELEGNMPKGIMISEFSRKEDEQ